MTTSTRERALRGGRDHRNPGRLQSVQAAGFVGIRTKTTEFTVLRSAARPRPTASAATRIRSGHAVEAPALLADAVRGRDAKPRCVGLRSPQPEIHRRTRDLLLREHNGRGEGTQPPSGRRRSRCLPERATISGRAKLSRPAGRCVLPRALGLRRLAHAAPGILTLDLGYSVKGRPVSLVVRLGRVTVIRRMVALFNLRRELLPGWAELGF